MRLIPADGYQAIVCPSLLWFVLLAGWCAGCAPAVRLVNPADWPQTWCERRLYHTPLAYIYAGSDAAEPAQASQPATSSAPG